MLKKLTADALGISDIGKIIDPKDFNRVDSDDYILHEDNEKIFFLIKSKSDEYCFTERAMLHIDGANAMSKKRLLTRYEYYRNPVQLVQLETAGNIDLDVEIKFFMGEKPFSIDVDKRQLEQLKDLYKTLIEIAEISYENKHLLNASMESLTGAKAVLGSARLDGVSVVEEFKNINEYSFDWIKSAREQYIVKDFTNVFKKYINN